MMKFWEDKTEKNDDYIDSFTEDITELRYVGITSESVEVITYNNERIRITPTGRGTLQIDILEDKTPEGNLSNLFRADL